MGNALEFLLKLTDMLTPGMRQAAAVTDSSAARIQRQMEQTQGSTRRMSASVNELRDRLDAINKVRFSTTIKKEFDESTRAAQRLERQISKLEGTSSSGSRLLAGLSGGLVAMGLGKSALGLAAEREQQRISFGVMTGSKEAGDQMLNDIVKMGAKTPFESGDLVKAAQTMKQFGIENGKIMPNLQMLGDVAGGNAEKLQSLSLAFSQVQSTGRLQGQDLLQLINSGFNPLLVISQQTGISMAELKKKMEAGAISADMVTKAFQSATGPGGQFYQMMEKQSQTLAGRWSTFLDNGKQKLLAFGNALMPIASWLLDFASAAMEGEPWAVALAAGIGLLTLSVTWATIQTTAYSLATKSAAFFTGIWNGVQAVFNATMWANPITWVIASIVALIAVIGYVIYTTDGWGKQWDNTIKFFKFSWASFKDYFTLLWLNVQDSFMSGLELIEKGWYKLKSLWDSEGAKAGLASINNQQAQRAAEIAKTKGVLETDLKAANDALKWELHSNGKGMGTMVADIKQKLGIGGLDKKGVSPVTAGAPGATSISKGDFSGLADGKAKGGANSINQGGQRSIVINVGKQIEKLEVHVMSAKEGAQEIESIVREATRRMLFGLNGVVTN